MSKTSKDGRVVFDEDTHTYWLECRRLMSVTKYISQFKVPFDKERISYFYARKHGMDQQDVLDMWQKKAEDACTMGTAVHKVFEDYILTDSIKTSGQYPKESIAEQFINDFFLSKRLTPVETEMIVYNDHLAGQIDCIAKDSKGWHYILDWKTNEEIKYEGYKGQKMLQPYNQYDDCNFNHYSLQLSVYSELCVEYNIRGGYIVHLSDDGYKLIPIRKM